MEQINQDGEYLEKTRTWHVEDSEWKAPEIGRVLDAVECPIESAAEVGCGAGRVLQAIAEHPKLVKARLYGFDISPQAIDLCEELDHPRIEFSCSDPLDEGDPHRFDALFVIDVFEHVPDYLGFVRKCKAKAKYKIYHIPLDLHVSSVLRDRLPSARRSVGHLHYFSASTALATLEDTGHRIREAVYTSGALGLYRARPSVKSAVASVPRWLFSRVSVPITARLFGGYSLLVLAE